jgi:DNA-binding LacI/PurR family transcriptional regulator
MRKQSAAVIGLIITDIQNPFFTALVRAVEDIAYQNQYTVLLCNSDEDAEKERLYMKVLSTERVAGVIVVPASNDCRESILDLRVPVVVVDRKIPGLVVDSVVIDNVAGARKATNHLITLGHRRIGLVSAPASVSVGRERRQGYEQALKKHGLPVDQNLIRMGDFKESGGYRAALELLSCDPKPTAIFAVNNLMTMGTLKAIHDSNLRIPEDISVIGFDDMPWLTLLTPPLTAVCQPTYQIGAEAAKRLFRRLQGARDIAPETLVLQPELIIRSSTAPLAIKRETA